jgi:hypothetical protein
MDPLGKRRHEHGKEKIETRFSFEFLGIINLHLVYEPLLYQTLTI